MSKKKSKNKYPNGGPLNTSGPRNTNTADTYVPLDGTRPYYVNKEGQKVSEGKITVGFDDGVYVIPTVWDGVQHTNDEAVERYKKTGRHMGKFKTQEEADRASQLRTSIYNNNPAYFASGGKLGDALKLTGDTLLSTVGLTDVIGDDAYRNQGFADASRVGEQIGLGAGKVAGNLLLPGMGGALVSQGQNLLGNVDGEDLERQRIAEMRANPGKFGKYASSISQMNSAIDPLAMGAAFAGEAGSAVAGNIMQAPAGANLQQKLLGNMYDPLAASFGKGLLGRNRNDVNPLQKPSINTIPNSIGEGMPEYGSLNAFGGKMYAKGGMIKRADGSYSKRGLWDNIRANKGSNKKPTKDMLAQEAKIKKKMMYGGKMKYPDGGNILMPEQVIMGSDRYNELQKQAQAREAYLQQQKYFQDLGVDLKPTALSNIEKDFSGLKDMIPTGAEMAYQVPSDSVKNIHEFYNKKLGVETFMDPTTSSGYLTGLADPGEVPEYEVIDPYADIDMSIAEEKTYNPIQASYKRGGSGNTTRGNIGYTYGYQSDPSSLEFQTQSPYGNEDIYQLKAGDRVSTFDKNIDPLVQEHMNYLNARKAAENMEPVVSFANGGNIDLMSNGEKFVEYQGPSHEGGGINIDNQGMPTNAPTQNEVEGGETLDDNGIDQYIFSDRIVSNPGEKNKKTYADLSKKINNKYKNTDEDPIQERTRRLELEQLKSEQEAAKAMMNESSDDMMGMQDTLAYGGKMKYPDGGTLKPIPIGYEEPFVLDNFGPFAPINTNDPTINQLYNMQQGMQQNVGPVNTSVNRLPNASVNRINNIYNPMSLNDQLGLMSMPETEDFYGDVDMNMSREREEDVSKLPITSLKTPPETMSLDEAIEMSDSTKDKKSKEDKDTDTAANQLPQDVINPLGYLASNVGNIYDLAQAAQDTPANDFGGVNLDTINLEGQRDELRKQAGAASAVARRNARNAGSAGAAFTNQAISNALINANLASSLSQSYMTEEQQNTAIKNQEEQINQQVRIQEKLADQQDLALRKSTVSQALHNIGMNTQGFTKDLESARVGNINNEMWFNAIKEGKYIDMRYDAATGSTVIINKDGSVWNKAADGSITEVKPDKELSKKEQETISNLFIR